MNFSKISKVLVSFAFANMFSCGIIGAQTDSSSAEVMAKSSDVELPNVALSSEAVELNKDSTENNSDSSAPSVNDSSEEKKLVCENLGSFTVNSSVSKQSSHFGLFKGENGLYRIQDITDENKDDKSKLGECQSYSVKYSCFMCYQPDCKTKNEKIDSESRPDVPVPESKPDVSVSGSKSEESAKEEVVESASKDVEISAS